MLRFTNYYGACLVGHAVRQQHGVPSVDGHAVAGHGFVDLLDNFGARRLDAQHRPRLHDVVGLRLLAVHPCHTHHRLHVMATGVCLLAWLRCHILHQHETHLGALYVATAAIGRCRACKAFRRPECKIVRSDLSLSLQTLC